MEVEDQQRRHHGIDANPPWNGRGRTLITNMEKYLEKVEKAWWESVSWRTSYLTLEKKRSCRLQKNRRTKGDAVDSCFSRQAEELADAAKRRRESIV